MFAFQNGLKLKTSTFFVFLKKGVADQVKYLNLS